MYYIDFLKLKGFRNYQDEQFNFSPRLNLFFGENGQGKTNIIEAIYYLTVTRSFRTNRDQELTNWNDNYFFIKGTFIKGDFKDELQVSYRSGTPLNVKINRENQNRFDHLQKYPVVVFSPDDLLLIREGPSIRRRFLNLEGSRLSPVYFSDLRAFQRVLQQRNSLLKEGYKNRYKGSRSIEPWNESLASLG
ncbi:MAG: DNA replication/repair protein RecF, partial [Bacillota bacterium]